MQEQGQLVQLKQADGSEYTMREHLYDGIKYYLYPKFAEPKKLLHHLQNYKPVEGDIWLLTYHKAGTNWVYEIIGILLRGDLKPLPDSKLETFIEFYPEVLDENQHPQILNAHVHDKYLPNCIFEKTKAVVVVRNPKSVATSAYHFCLDRKGMNYSGSFPGFLPVFNESGAFGEYCGTWYEYYLSLWNKYKRHPNVLFVFYEELKKDPVPNIKKMADFLGVERDDEFCKGVAELSSFENMKQGIGKKPLQLPVTIQRKGTIDDWKNQFTVAMNEEFDKEFEEKMKDHLDLKERIQFM